MKLPIKILQLMDEELKGWRQRLAFCMFLASFVAYALVLVNLGVLLATGEPLLDFTQIVVALTLQLILMVPVLIIGRRRRAELDKEIRQLEIKIAVRQEVLEIFKEAEQHANTKDKANA